MQSNYNVDYEVDGRQFTETKVYSSDPGTAMAEVQKRFPECKLIKAWNEGSYRDGYGYQEWLVPTVQRPLFHKPRRTGAVTKRKMGCEFPFYDEVVSHQRD